MVALDEIRQLPLQEKLKVMEAIWESIAPSEEQLDVPQWHKDILDEREQLIREGKAKFIDWETAKKEIKKSIS
jgi:putative addiction module component (TIGR02574 family)